MAFKQTGTTLPHKPLAFIFIFRHSFPPQACVCPVPSNAQLFSLSSFSLNSPGGRDGTLRYSLSPEHILPHVPARVPECPAVFTPASPFSSRVWFFCCGAFMACSYLPEHLFSFHSFSGFTLLVFWLLISLPRSLLRPTVMAYCDAFERLLLLDFGFRFPGSRGDCT